MPGKTTSLRKNSIIFKSCQEERYMKNRKSSKLLALGLVFALGLGLSTAFAAVSVTPATTKVTVDGKNASVEAYNIDNGNNYFKLRDFATNLDFGLTWDAATDTAAIDTTTHYKPDATQLITGNWAPATRARIQAVIDENAGKGRYVVFDFDNTSVIFDVQEALLVYQTENLIFKIAPEDMEAVLETGIPDLDKEMGKSIDGKTITPATLVADLVSDYAWIYNNYSGMKGDKIWPTSTPPTSTRISPPSCALCTTIWATTLITPSPIPGSPISSPA